MTVIERLQAETFTLPVLPAKTAWSRPARRRIGWHGYSMPRFAPEGTEPGRQLPRMMSWRSRNLRFRQSRKSRIWAAVGDARGMFNPPRWSRVWRGAQGRGDDGAGSEGSIGKQPSGGGEVAIRGFRFGRLFGIVCSTAPLFWVKPPRRRGLGPENAKIAGPVWPGAPNSFLNSRLRHAGSTPR